MVPVVAGGRRDPLFSFVALLLHGNGIDGSRTIVDNSPSPIAVNVIGDTKVSTAQSRFGGASLYFDGNGDYLTEDNATRWDFGTGDFCIETWAYFENTNGNAIIELRASTGASSITINRTGGNNEIRALINGTHRVFSSSVPINTWVHLAVDRQGGQIRCFFNGVNGYQAANSTNYSQNALTIGTYIDTRTANTSFKMQGWLDDIRITKGAGRYAANFTPPDFQAPDA